MGTITIARLPADGGHGFRRLCAEAISEGYHFMARLETRLESGELTADPAARVLCAFDGEDVVAVGAVTRDPYDDSDHPLRLRHFYVRPDHRGSGVGRRLARALVADALSRAALVTLRAADARSEAFWEALGFTRVEHPTRTHVLHGPAQA